MAVTRNFSTVVKIVEHAELQSQLVLIRSDIGAVERERGVAVPRLQVAENLIVGAIFFNYVDDMLNGILAVWELKRSGIVMQQVVSLDGAGEFFEVAEGRRNIQPGNRATQQRGNVGMVAMSNLPRSLTHAGIWPGATTFGGSDEQIVSLHRKRAGVPIGGNKTECREFALGRRRIRKLRNVKYRHCVGRRVRHEQELCVFRLSQRAWIAAEVLLIAHGSIQVCNRLAALSGNNSD